MPDTSLILSLPYIQPSQAQKHVTHNEALRLLDVLVQLVVVDRSRAEPPETPTEGDSHIVADAATGDWVGQENAIASFDGTAWQFLPPKAGWSAQVLAEDRAVVFDGTQWGSQQAAPETLDGLESVGINTTSDATNRLAVSGPATLLTHDGSGHQLKINKAADTDTASLLFQTGWSGRAEMGTTGTDGFSVKVSANGGAWFTGLAIDPVTGQTSFPQGASVSGTLSGSAVQQSPNDTTPGRLMRADYGYGPGNLLGAVSQSGGLPTGAVIESGSNANGDYIRFADGTQICIQNLDLTYQNGTKLTETWTYPAPFIDANTLFLSGMINISSFNQNVTGPDIVSVLDVRFGTITATSVLAQMFRLNGATNFAAADFCSCRLFALGRWV